MLHTAVNTDANADLLSDNGLQILGPVYLYPCPHLKKWGHLNP